MKIPKTGDLKPRLRKYANIVILFVAILLSISLFKGVSRIRRAEDKISQTRDKIEKLEKENQELEVDLGLTENETYLEKQLRDGLGYAKENEIVIVLPDEEILRKLAPRLEVEQEDLPKKNWEKWAEVFEIPL